MTLEIDGNIYEFDDANPNKLEYGISKESGKQAVKFVWLEEYKRDFSKNVYERHCHLLECSSRGTMTFDGKRITNKEASALFQGPLFGK